MQNDYDKIEEELKKSASRRSAKKKGQKVSGKSVFKLQKIIILNAQNKKEEEEDESKLS